MSFYAHYDSDADIAWLHVEPFDGATVRSEEAGHGLTDRDRLGNVVGVEVWRASERLPAAMLELLPPPRVRAHG
jgi:uncharacterized protein YuzE